MEDTAENSLKLRTMRSMSRRYLLKALSTGNGYATSL
jgi:hypothetical protein